RAKARTSGIHLIAFLPVLPVQTRSTPSDTDQHVWAPCGHGTIAMRVAHGAVCAPIGQTGVMKGCSASRLNVRSWRAAFAHHALLRGGGTAAGAVAAPPRLSGISTPPDMMALTASSTDQSSTVASSRRTTSMKPVVGL